MLQQPLIIRIQSISDNRGYNAILYDSSVAVQMPGFPIAQINQAFSIYKHTLRGLHYQTGPYAQAKMCYCLCGSVYNVALGMKTGEAIGEVLNPGTAMFIPKGYAHGYLTLEPNTLFQWCVDNDFAPEAARVIHYSSVETWPVDDWSKVVISEKDRNGEKLSWPG